MSAIMRGIYARSLWLLFWLSALAWAVGLASHHA
jgi:hypothetical protein